MHPVYRRRKCPGKSSPAVPKQAVAAVRFRLTPPPIAQVAGPMVEHILSALASFAIWVISTGGYLGIMLLMAIESACIPLPSEIIMPFAGYLVSTGQFNLYLAATAGRWGAIWARSSPMRSASAAGGRSRSAGANIC